MAPIELRPTNDLTSRGIRSEGRGQDCVVRTDRAVDLVNFGDRVQNGPSRNGRREDAIGSVRAHSEAGGACSTALFHAVVKESRGDGGWFIGGSSVCV